MQCDLLKLKLTWEKFILKCLAFLQRQIARNNLNEFSDVD